MHTEFPPHVTVSVPASLTVTGATSIAPRLARQPYDWDTTLGGGGGRLAWVEANVVDLEEEALSRLQGHRAKLRVATEDLPQVGKNAEALRGLAPVFLVGADATLMTKVQYLVSLRFPVQVDAIGDPDEEALVAACDYYLHNPALHLPIEPFHSLLAAWVSKKRLTLWEMQTENPHFHAFVTEDGRVTLGERWRAAGHDYGPLGQEWRDLERSPLYRRMQTHFEDLFRARSPCCVCAELPLCGGYLRAIDGTARCEAWVRVFSALRQSAVHAQDLLAAFPSEERN